MCKNGTHKVIKRAACSTYFARTVVYDVRGH